MASKCMFCGKNFGLMSTGYTVLKDSDDMICVYCDVFLKSYTKIMFCDDSINEEYDSVYKDMILQYKSNGYSDEGIEYLNKYLLQRKRETEVNNSNDRFKKQIEIERTEEGNRLLEFSLKHRYEHKTTSSNNFEGYRIREYLGVISGSVVLGTGFLSEFLAGWADSFGTYSEAFARKMEESKNEAVERLIRVSYSKGGNAIIGVDFDYFTLKDNMIAVSANGTAVIIESME